MNPKNRPVLIGDYTWQETRDLLIVQLKKCRTQEEFSRIASAIAASIGTLKEITRLRKRMGIRPLSKEEIRRLKG